MLEPPLRIAILECDTPLDKTKAKFGGYGGVFKQLLQRGADALKHPGLSSSEGLELTFWHVVDEEDKYPKLEDIDAILISGSRYNSFEDASWILKLVAFTEKVLVEQDRVKVIGVCFGHQIVARALRTPVGRNDAGWEVSVVPLELTQDGKKLFKQDKLSLYQMHRDIAYDFPSTVKQLASTASCSNQGMYEKGRLITVQGHPEFTHDIVEEILESREEMGIFPKGVFADGMKRLKDHDDGVVVAQAFLRFMLEDEP